MQREDHPFNYNFRQRFPRLREVYRTGGEDAVVYYAEQEDKFYSVIDQSFLMEFAGAADDENVRNKLVSVIEFETEAQRQAWLDNLIQKASQE